MKDAGKVLGLILLCSLLWAAACSTGTVAKSTATLTPAEQEEQDPMFWRDWASSHGIGP
jgi:hypothetical protein